MKVLIKEFLQQHGGHATALQIAREVFHTRNASAALADKLIRAALDGAAGIETDGLGSWHLATGMTDERWEHQKFCLIEVSHTKSRPYALAFGWVTIQNGQISRPIFAALSDTSLPSATSVNLEMSPAPVLCRRLHEALAGNVLVAWRPASVQQSLSSLASVARGEPFFCDALSLLALAQNLFGLPTMPKPERVYQLLGLPRSVFEESIAGVEEAAGVFVEMLARCGAAQIVTTEQLLAAGRRRAQRLDMALYDFDRRFLENLPESPGIYLMRDQKEKVLYVGKAKNLRSRVISYFQRPEEEEPKLRRLQKSLRSLSYETCETELDALIREYELIRHHQPIVNLQIDLHSDKENKLAITPCIFFVPIPSSRRLAIYFLSTQRLEKLVVVAGRKIGKRLQAAAEEFMQPLAKPVSAMNHRVLLAMRWLAQHRDELTVLEENQLSSTADCLHRLQSLISDEEVFRERVEMRGARPGMALNKNRTDRKSP